MKTKTMTTTYADTLEAGYELETYFRSNGTPAHSAYSQNFTVTDGDATYTMSITPSSNIPRYTKQGFGASVSPAVVYAALLQI